jgi:hypothetical protein
VVNISRFTESISGSCMEGRGPLQGSIVALWPDHAPHVQTNQNEPIGV